MKRIDSIKNLVFGLLSFIITTLMGIIIPRLFLLSYGSEVNGLINSIKQIFTYFALLEAGVGGATLQALYAPMARNDKKEVSAILSATSIFLRKTGILYAMAVLVLSIVYPFTIQTEISKITIMLLILLQGEGGVIKYFITNKLQLLLKVDGKTYIMTNVSTFFAIFSNIARIILLSMGSNVVLVQSVFCIVDLLQVIILVIYTKKHYSWLNLNTKPNFNAISQRHSVLVHQISGLIFNNTDTIILTYFCGLKVVSVYAMYSMLFAMVSNIIGYISSSVSFAMGQLFHSDKKRFILVQEIYETYYLCLSFAFFTIALIFITPFIKLYTSGVDDINYTDKLLPILFVILQTLNYGRNTSNNIIDFAGHYAQTQWRSLFETSINVVGSLILVQYFGLYGVLMGTILALLYRTNDIILYANHKIMERSAWPTYKRWLCNVVVLFGCYYFSGMFIKDYQGYVSLLIDVSIYGFIILLIFIVTNSILNSKESLYVLNYLKGNKVLKRK